MKQIYLAILLVTLTRANAQITTPVIRANFGVDADLRSNFFNNLNQAGNDDWFARPAIGTGKQIIDTSGAAAIVAAYTTNPASRMWPFFRLMDHDPFAIVNNRMVLDAIFHRDFHGTDSTVFAAGSNKNGMSPQFWTCPVAQNIPDKNDILDAYTHVRRAGPNPTDSLWMFGALSIENTTGNRYFDFELYQTDLYYDRTLRRFFNYGPDEGHTSWKFDAAGNIVTPGDIIFSAEYSSSALSAIEARIWINKADMGITPVAFNWGGVVDGASASSTYGYAKIIPKTAGAFYTGLQSGNGVWAGPFAVVLQDNSVVTSYIARQFMEFSVNLSKLGIDPAMFSTNPCASPYRRVVIKTRASTSFTAELKDFVAPYRMFDYVGVDAYTDLLYFCESMPQTQISVANPNATSIYTWSTTNGNIVGTNTGTTITVDMPGTYTVQQQLHALCPIYAMDTVTIMYDSICTVLQLDFPRIEVSRRANQAFINWDVLNNHLASYYTVEFSRDNHNFEPLTMLSSTQEVGSESYNYSHSLQGLENDILFFRVKGVDANNRYKYSETALLRIGTKDASLFPNPTDGRIWINIDAGNNNQADILIVDVFGRVVHSEKRSLRTGANLIEITSLKNMNSGTYWVKTKVGTEEKTTKVIKY